MSIIGIDIGGTNFRIGLVEGMQVVRFNKVPTLSVIRTEDVLGDIAAFIREFTEGLSFEAVAIGFPATLDRERKKVLQAPNLKFMEDLPVVERLEKELGVPVVAERDVTMALCFDSRKYGLPEEGMICGIYFGTGIGNAISIDGKPWKGHNGTAGELGHIPVDGSDEPCGCGNIGCMESLGGGKYLAKLQKEQYPKTPIGEMFLKHAEEESLKQFIDRMAIAVATEVNILDPDAVLIGGGILNMPGFPKELLNERIYLRLRKPYPAESLKILYTEDEADKSVIGGAIYASQKLKNGGY